MLVSERPAQWNDFLFPYYDGSAWSLISNNTQRPFTLPLPWLRPERALAG